MAKRYTQADRERSDAIVSLMNRMVKGGTKLYGMWIKKEVTLKECKAIIAEALERYEPRAKFLNVFDDPLGFSFRLMGVDHDVTLGNGNIKCKGR